ncbi:MAG: MMPL family transporter, partial [Gammaproteobacteria bacterium]|nr:MMPL family transporter [Gammaproteobacteria bacterium]
MLISGVLAENLELKTNFKDLMPQSHPIVSEYNNIVENYLGATMEIIGAVGEEESLINFVNDIAPEIATYTSLVKRVEYKLNKDFFEDHGFMVMKQKDLKNSLNTFGDLGLLPYISEINNSFETTYIADGEESISNKEKEMAAVSQLDALKEWIEAMGSYMEGSSAPSFESTEKLVDKMLFGDEYFLSQDKKMIMFMVQPAFPFDDLAKAEILINRIDSLINEKISVYPDITLAGPCGLMAIGVDEMRAVEKDMSLTTILAFILILALFILSFRMWSAPLLAFTSLLIGIVLTVGFVTLAIGSLNIMTSMFAVILIGLGIDFNIHVITTYNQIRAGNQT